MPVKASHKSNMIYHAMQNFKPSPYNEVAAVLNKAAADTADYINKKKDDILVIVGDDRIDEAAAG